MTVKQAKNDLLDAMATLYGDGEARAIVRYVFDDYFQLDAENAGHDAVFSSLLTDEYAKIKARLARFEPVQYVVGFAWFYGLKFKVNNTVLVPRPETEELVYTILEKIKQLRPNGPLSILDIGTGSGCIPVTLKVKNPELIVSAVDISEAALITASRNAFRMNADVSFKRVDILNANEWPLLPETLDVIVSNPPYIPHREKTLMHANVLNYEPHLALFVEDGNPLVFYEKIADLATERLDTEGYLYFECNAFNAHEVADMLRKKGFEASVMPDMSGKNRMIEAKKNRLT